MFRRRPEPENTPVPQPAPSNVSENGFDPTAMRAELFVVLATRIGPEYAAIIEEDFRGHIESDPVNGVEQAYFCLTGKLIETVDLLNDAPTGNPLSRLSEASANPVSADAPTDFTIFRKEIK